jgi:hypothetical protein
LDIRLPSLDVDAMKAIWHVYLPQALAPLSFDGNLTQYTAIRYDPFRRARDFLDQALSPPPARAGAKYRSILSKRKGIFRAEAAKKGRGELVLASFPLVGTRYRFKRILPGRETPALSVWYLAGWMQTAVRWAAFGLAVLLTVLLARPGRRWWAWIPAVVGFCGLLVAAHFVLGVHRRIVWAVDLGLLAVIVRVRAGPLWQALRQRVGDPGRLAELATLRNLLIVLGAFALARLLVRFPLLSSLGLLVALVVWWWHSVRPLRTEVADAS